MIPLHDDNVAHSTPFISYAIIGLCVAVFLWQLTLDPRSLRAAILALGFIPALLLSDAQLPLGIAMVPPTVSVFTSMFLHGGWLHLLGNMLFLWIFSDNVEDRMGHGRFVLFYLLCGIAAAAAQALPAPQSIIPMIGASGAISGVLGAYLMLFPHARVLVVIPLGFFFYSMRLKAIWVLGIWFGLQLFQEIMAGEGAGVAFRAHIGGFIAGMILIVLFRKKGVKLWQEGRTKPRSD